MLRDTSGTEAFCDRMFAIAVSLLVLDPACAKTAFTTDGDCDVSPPRRRLPRAGIPRAAQFAFQGRLSTPRWAIQMPPIVLKVVAHPGQPGRW